MEDASGAAFEGATVTFLDPAGTDQIAALGQSNFSSNPNPFTNQTTISYGVADGTKQVELTIFDMLGRTVKTIVNERQSAGQHTAIWNAEDAKGQRVNAGTYFYRIEVDGKVAAKRVVVF